MVVSNQAEALILVMTGRGVILMIDISEGRTHK
jgi:hypothetical protein